MINKDNTPSSQHEEIVLKINDEICFCAGQTLILIKFNYVDEEIDYIFGGSRIYGSFSTVHKILSVNGKQGKYIIPEFDFKQTLLDAGWEVDGDIIHNGAIWVNLRLRNFCDDARQIKLTPANAEKLIMLAKRAERLEHE